MQKIIIYDNEKVISKINIKDDANYNINEEELKIKKFSNNEWNFEIKDGNLIFKEYEKIITPEEQIIELQMLLIESEGLING